MLEFECLCPTTGKASWDGEKVRSMSTPMEWMEKDWKGGVFCSESESQGREAANANTVKGEVEF